MSWGDEGDESGEGSDREVVRSGRDEMEEVECP